MATGTFEPITTTSVNSTSSVTFSSISGLYTDIVFVFDGAAAAGAEFGIRFNSDTGNNYSSIWFAGGINPTQSSRYAANSYATFNYVRSSNPATVVAHIQNYSNTTTYKTVISRTAEPDNSWLCASSWKNTSAITSITLLSGSNFSNATVSLYGIKAE